MFEGKFYLFFTIYSGAIVISQMVRGGEKDIYAPNDDLKKHTSVTFRKVLYGLIISFFIFGLAYVILDIPRLVNRDFALYDGKIEEIKKTEDHKYDIILECDGEEKSFPSVYAEELFEGSYIEIGIPPNPLYRDIVIKNNHSITALYKKYYGSNFMEKAGVIFYCILNFFIQSVQLKKAKPYGINRLKMGIYLGWRIGMYSFSGVLFLSLANMVNNLLIGVLAGGLYVLYNFCCMIYPFVQRGETCKDIKI